MIWKMLGKNSWQIEYDPMSFYESITSRDDINSNQMGNKILGKRSRNFYKGFNERQLTYLRDKFESLSEGGKLKKDLFIKAY